jgi:hypothetical protein
MGRLGADLRITGPGVAPQHVELRREADGSVLLSDLGTAMGTTLAGARLAAPLPVGGGLSVDLAGRVPLYVAPLGPGHGASFVIEAAGTKTLAPLGPLRIGQRGDLDALDATDPWTLALAGAEENDLGPAVVVRAPADAGPQLLGARADREIDVCFGDVICRTRGGPPFVVFRPAPGQADH